MAVDAVIYVQLTTRPSEAALDSARARFMADHSLDEDDFRRRRPLVFVQAAGLGEVLDVNFWGPYYGRGYERGELALYVQFAEWLEKEFPGCKVWYGNDVEDDSFWPFGPAEREVQLKYFREVGHEPYDSKFRTT
jgi:hypothetical protein